DILIVVLSAAAFVALFAVTQWHFSKFLLSNDAQNWFFAADRHWGYMEAREDWRRQFWDAVDSKSNPSVRASTYGISFACALVSSAVGLALGNWMSKVRR